VAVVLENERTMYVPVAGKVWCALTCSCEGFEDNCANTRVQVVNEESDDDSDDNNIDDI